jgi:hypothetical protein
MEGGIPNITASVAHHSLLETVALPPSRTTATNRSYTSNTCPSIDHPIPRPSGCFTLLTRYSWTWCLDGTGILTKDADNGLGILGVMGVAPGVGGVNVIGRVDEEPFLCQGAEPDPDPSPDPDEMIIGVGSGMGRNAE